jgi:hypothetical protein
MKFIFWVIVIVCIWFWWTSSEDPAIDPDLILSDPAAEAHRQQVIRHAKENQIEGYPLYTDEERHIVYQKQYEKEQETSDFIMWVFIIFLASLPFFAVCPKNPLGLITAIICMVILIVTGNYLYIVVGLLIHAIIIPTLIVMGINSLFSKN